MSRTQLLQQDKRSLVYLSAFPYMIQRLRDVCLEEKSYSPPNSPMEHKLLVLVLYYWPFPDQTISTSMTLMAQSYRATLMSNTNEKIFRTTVGENAGPSRAFGVQAILISNQSN